ncbi:glutathione S-transferase-like protein [Mucidula mucida]|nr:glutathione S-transferase-like protein [Mucidula mucida]
MAETRPSKIRKTTPYKLFYWPGIPGRGEFVRLAFEYTGTPYVEASDPAKLLPTITNAKNTGGAPPAFAPPALELPSGRVICQTPSILNYLAPTLGLAGWDKEEKLDDDEKEEIRACVNQVVLTALDLNNEIHDSHHPIATSLYYEDQKPAAAERAKDFRALRLPKYFKYFEDVLAANPANKDNADGPFCVSKYTTTADLAVSHVVEGLMFAFPKRMTALRDSGKYPLVFKLHERVNAGDGIKAYLASERRKPFSMGTFRHYPELDGDE